MLALLVTLGAVLPRLALAANALDREYLPKLLHLFLQRHIPMNHLNDELRERALADGFHALVGWDGPLMTDSGTFQSHVYGDIEIEPQAIVEFQRDIGSDIGTVLDVFTEP